MKALYLLAASTFMGLNAFAASVWTPSFLERVHGLSIGTIASIIGPTKGLFGLAGVLTGGFLIDRLIRRSPHWRVTLPALACLLLAPVEVVFLLAEPQWLWIAAFAASAFLTLIHQGPLFALVMEVVSSRVRLMYWQGEMPMARVNMRAKWNLLTPAIAARAASVISSER